MPSPLRLAQTHVRELSGMVAFELPQMSWLVSISHTNCLCGVSLERSGCLQSCRRSWVLGMTCMRHLQQRLLVRCWPGTAAGGAAGLCLGDRGGRLSGAAGASGACRGVPGRHARSRVRRAHTESERASPVPRDTFSNTLRPSSQHVSSIPACNVTEPVALLLHPVRARPMQVVYSSCRLLAWHAYGAHLCCSKLQDV